jgi:valyl-tRNA synthetase
MTELPKTFDPAAIEQRWYEHWESNGLFRPDRADAEPWTIVMPPPNVTGSLHIGHALDNTLQDILTRRERMLGKDALWVVGVDHAGIATQMVVERNLESQGVRRGEIGREAFLEHVWEWKAQSGGAITRQLRRLGASCDWSNERFTMDEGFSKAVVKVFVELHRRGLLYRDKRLVNWDPRFQTAISDLEVETREVQGQFWTLRYPLAGDARTGTGSSHIKVATTRPETMLADMAVAVHPDDERYKALIGKQVEHPITGRLIPIIADEHADPELGSGAVKITPGHDFNDYEVGKRAGFKPADMLNMFDATAHVVQTSDGLIPQDLVGLSREEARKQVLDRLMAGGFLAQVEDRVIPTPYGDRSGVVIEPWLTDQWYVDVKPLAERVIAATKSGEIKIVPETWAKTWFHWLENIQPWCVSRQLWWGHRIPAWYADDGNVFVAETFEAAQQQAGGLKLRQDEDVLDTWFSSALWPFVTLGWPEETHDLKRHYPNAILNSGFDILFFWDARMAMMGLEFMGEVPWRTLYLHGLIRDAKGQKMSKSKGNTVDPLGIIDKYGADALRFTLAAMESQGRDIKLDEKRVEGYRNFATKLWNAARFLQMNGVGASQSVAAPEADFPVNRWIIGEVVETLGRLDRAFDELRFDEMADAIYHFVWGTFCDWYVELVKGAFDEETKRVAAWAFDQILVMLHPFMPFVTEELWNANERPYELIVAKWPAPEAQRDPQAKAEIEWLTGLIADIRATKSALGTADKSVNAFISKADNDKFELIDRYLLTIKRMARLSEISVRTPDGVQQLTGTFGGMPFDAETIIAVEGEGKVQIPYPGLVGTLDFFGLVDLEVERGRLSKAISTAEKERDSLASRLSNPNFTERAKPEAVEKARADHAEKSAEAERYRAALERLG